MIEDQGHIPEEDHTQGQETITRVTGMYKDWFLDYASYVILERAVPAIEDGFKPVQRRILHSMKDLDDGRYNKVANIVGHTMQYHPHGDASIADAMVQIGQKDLLIDTQGNWGNILTGDRAAASRYIEARLSKFALDVVFNPKTTEWQASYDGRRKEPINLPVKFPLLLAQGAEGIAVGLSTKVLPHNFIELIEASIKHLQGKRFTIVPDFATGGIADFSNYYTNLVEENEPNAYGWGFFQRGDNIMLIERYKDEAAHLNHITNISPEGILEKEFGQFLEHFDILEIDVFGDVTEEHKSIINGFNFPTSYNLNIAKYSRN